MDVIDINAVFRYFEAQGSYLLGIATRRAAASGAEDRVQETFVAVCERVLDASKPPLDRSGFPGYVFRTLLNHCADTGRAARRRPVALPANVPGRQQAPDDPIIRQECARLLGPC